MITVDKISSSTKNVPLSHKLAITEKIISREGYVLAVEVLDNKKIYNQIELTSGRLSTLHKGEIVIVTLGERRALKGFVGHVPKRLKSGDTINILNIGGICGICDSENYQTVGHALKVKVLGAVTDKKGKPLSIKDFRIFEPADRISNNIPLILVSGTCMEVGKTTTACELIKVASRNGFKTCSAKIAGIAALRDTLRMEDNGTIKAVSIVDAGLTSTASKKGNTVKVTKGAINHLSTLNPDYIIIELGDGILGEYGVMDILKDSEIKKHAIAHIGCAFDPPGALKLSELAEKIGLKPDMISGPVTDNSVGTKFIESILKIPAVNSLTRGETVFPVLYKRCLRKRRNNLK
jgi:hypothetical protein